MRVLVTGAAGFVGSHAVRALSSAGHEVMATDVPVDTWRIAELISSSRLHYLAGDLEDTLPALMAGVEEVWHFAANADIPLGTTNTGIDLRESAVLTLQVLESMRRHDAPRIIFPSTSAVYGNGRSVARESDGPLLPPSLYGAGKLASEGLISAFAHTFGIRGLIFRLGNVVGGSMGRGIVRDFIAKLQINPTELAVLGNGRQRKSYVLVDDVIDAMAWMAAHPPTEAPALVVNVAAGGSLDVAGVAGAVAAALGIPAPRLVTSDAEVSWAGDQPIIELDIQQALSTGWRPKATVGEAVMIAARRMIEQQRKVT